MTSMFARLPSLARALRRDRSGLAMMEFAFTLPIVLTMGGYGVELSYLSVSNLRVYQAAANLADTASRVGTVAGTVTQVSEADINDVLQGIWLANQGIQLTTYGRITLSSLENVQQGQDGGRVERIHWQRCMGQKSGSAYVSRYPVANMAAGTTTDTAASHANEGIAKPAALGVTPPPDSGVMLVEVNYEYRPLFGSMFVSAQPIRYAQSFVVRDNRDFTHLHATSGATASKCDLYTRGPGGTNP